MSNLPNIGYDGGMSSLLNNLVVVNFNLLSFKKIRSWFWNITFLSSEKDSETRSNYKEIFLSVKQMQMIVHHSISEIIVMFVLNRLN